MPNSDVRVKWWRGFLDSLEWWASLACFNCAIQGITDGHPLAVIIYSAAGFYLPVRAARKCVDGSER